MGRVLVQQPGTNTAKALSETLPKNVIIVDEDLKELRLHDGVTPGGKIIGQSTGSGIPVGTIIPFAGNAVPQGYLLCDGSAISRTDYASLFAVIGTIYGAGDGNSTFNLPRLYDRVPLQTTLAAIGKSYDGRIPNITGSFSGGDSRNSNVSGVFRQTAYPTGFMGNAALFCTVSMNASLSSGVYQATTIVEPAGISMKYIIKH